MTLKKLCLTLLGFVIAFSSCQKAEEEVSFPGPRIKKMVSYFEGELRTNDSFEYDQSGKLIKRTYFSGLTDHYTYKPNMILIRRSFPNETEHFPDTIYLNEQGLKWQTSAPRYTCEYDQQGYLVKSKDYSYSLTCEVWQGNTSRITNTDYNNHVENTWSMTHLPNTTNTIGNENMGISFLGKQDNNLLKTMHYAFYMGDTTNWFHNYSYEYDEKMRVIKRIDTIKGKDNTTLTLIENYTYY